MTYLSFYSLKMAVRSIMVKAQFFALLLLSYQELRTSWSKFHFRIHSSLKTKVQLTLDLVDKNVGKTGLAKKLYARQMFST